MKTKGFTLIELLVVIVIIGILVAIALPNFIKIKDKAKEAEVKQNLHSIQLAIERYGTDVDGIYPFFLYGGDGRYNIGTVNGVSGANGGGNWWGTGGMKTPFDMFFMDTDTWDYADAGSFGNLENPNLESGFGDTLSYEGYLPKSPSNPFLSQQGAVSYSLEGLNWNYPHWACWGGRDGKLMFNVGFDSCLFQLMKWDQRDADDNDILEFTGQYAYHARWMDGITNAGHQLAQGPYNNTFPIAYKEGEPPLDDSGQISSLDVAGYDLVAFGSTRTKGKDLDESVTFPAFNGGQLHFYRTGYLTLGQERNPYVETGMYDGNVQDYDERPYSDTVPDFIIIHLSSGLDQKIGNPLENN